jgi:hypothetical protein
MSNHRTVAFCCARIAYKLPALACLHHGVPHSRPFSQLAGRFNKMDPWLFGCKIDAEPIHRYQKGGYHPVHLGDVLNDGTYRILHKLGWGGYSTVWAARNLKFAILLYVRIHQADILPGRITMLLSRYQYRSGAIMVEKSLSCVLSRKRNLNSPTVTTL